MPESMSKFTLEQGLAIQRQQLEQWKVLLKPKVFDLLKSMVEHENESLTKNSDGYDVCRGNNIDVILLNEVAAAFAGEDER